MSSEVADNCLHWSGSPIEYSERNYSKDIAQELVREPLRARLRREGLADLHFLCGIPSMVDADASGGQHTSPSLVVQNFTFLSKILSQPAIMAYQTHEKLHHVFFV